jgi:hypothetical protein
MITRMRRSLGVVSSLVAAVALIAVGAATVGAKPAGRADSGTVHFATTYSAGSKTFAAGNGSDKLFGTGAVTYVIKTTPTKPGTIKITANPVTTYYKDGTLTGKGSATVRAAQDGSATITNGKIAQANGTGARHGHSFTGTFSGKGNPSTGVYAVTYKGTYR